MGKGSLKRIGKFRENSRDESLEKNRVIYIFTEGKQTEPNYFDEKKKEVRYPGIHVKGVGDNTLKVVDCAIRRMEKDQKSELNDGGDIVDDEYWVVFDKDEHTDRFDNAIKKAKAKGIKVAYSNESFELWFLLHFIFIDTNIGRDACVEKLKTHLKKKSRDPNYQYDKSADIYQCVKDKEDNAIKNAKRLLGQYSSSTPFSQRNPSTTVHLLVEELNKLKK